MYEELVTRCYTNACNGISPKDITLREAAYAIEELESKLFDGEGINLVSYWYQECQIAENGLRNALEELSQKEYMILTLRKELERMKTIMREHGIMVIPGGKSSWNIPSPK